MKPCWLFMACVALIMLLFFAGCCSTVVKDGNGKIIYQMESSGILRNGSADITEKDGRKIRLESSSATAGILGAVNELLGTTFNGATKAMP